jgi:phytoene dehydrogenase-like protein
VSTEPLDAVVVGSGPNGLAAAITLAQAGRSVHVIEGADTIGGGARTAELTLPGYRHDVCSAIHPFGRISPFFESVDLDDFGLRWIDPPVPFAHAMDDGPAVLCERSVDATARGLDPQDAATYRRVIGTLSRSWSDLVGEVLGPFRIPLNPVRIVELGMFGLGALQPASWFARLFRGDRARALLAGVAAHGELRLTEPISVAAGLALLLTAHTEGWPLPEGGSGRISDAMAELLAALRGSIETGRWVRSMAELPPHRVAVFDTTPDVLLGIAGDRLSGRYRRQLGSYRRGPGIFKLDLALDGPIPWRDSSLLRAGTVHLGGGFTEIARAEHAVSRGRVPERPYVLLAQQSLFDPTRAPAGHHTVWVYCHVPLGSTADMQEPILREIERHAPGFRDRIHATSVLTPADVEAANPNYLGGDISGGRMDLRQLWTRPAIRLNPYTTPDPDIFIGSAATPPGPGVHGVGGWLAAKAALERLAR